MHLQSIFVFLSVLATTTTANPLRRHCAIRGPDPPKPYGSTGVTYVLPSTGGPKSLPTPNTTVKHIAVGHGVQNYTCTAAGSLPAGAGALAVLYEITKLYPGSGENALSQDAWDTLTSSVLRTTSQPIEEDPTSPFPPPASLYIPGVHRNVQFLGHHFFNSAGVPTFSIGDGDGAETLEVQKMQGIPAPDKADKGLTNEGAVDWLYLADYNGNKVYRVLTAGGDPVVCQKAGVTQSMQYSAMYWFY